jgi:translation initiation factor IF-2
VGTIIESKVEKGRGNVATVLVQTGTLRVGDVVAVGRTHGRVRALQNAAGKRVKAAEPATAVEIIGLADLPEAGDILRVVADEKTARDMAEAAGRNGDGDGRAAFSLEDISAQIQASEVKELRVVLKTDVQGSLGAIRHALERLNTTEVRINILREGAGDINESDVLLASASDAVVIGFNTKADPGAQRQIDASGVDVRLYDVIYKLTDDVGAALQGMLAPKLVEQVEGHAEVRMVIKAGRAGNVAGSYVTDGRIVRGGEVRLFRGGSQVAEGRITSLKRFKDDVREVATGFECGIGLSIDDIAEGDVIECFQMVSEPA